VLTTIGTSAGRAPALRAASYAALSAASALSGAAGAAEQLAWCLPYAPLDARVVAAGLLAPHLPPVLGERVAAHLATEAAAGALVTRRAGAPRVRWWVGCWFRHRMFGYHAVVLGWTVRVAAQAAPGPLLTPPAADVRRVGVVDLAHAC
jgi:hypothetical protein